MPQQKLPLFNGLIQACHDGVGGQAATAIFSPPDKGLTPGSQAYYAVHLWLKPADDGAGDPFYNVVAFRSSNPGDLRVPWASSNAILYQITGKSNAANPIPAFKGVPVKILDGYIVRGDVVLELLVANANADNFAKASGTKLWGYYQRISLDDQEWRFIGDPPIGPLFDAGMPTLVGPSSSAIVHKFDPSRTDELYLSIVNSVTPGYGGPLSSATVELLDTSGAVLSQLELEQDFNTLGAPNYIRDPASAYTLHGVFGNNPNLASLRVTNNDANVTIFVHGRYARH